MPGPLIVKMDARLSKRFFSKVEKRGAGECQLWKAELDKRTGYPIFSIKGRRIHATKVAFALYAVFPPEGDGFDKEPVYINITEQEPIGRSCGNLACVAKRHLTPGIPTPRQVHGPERPDMGLRWPFTRD